MTQKKRRLADLYVRGQEVTFDDGEGDSLTVWVRKMTPVDHETALRAANAARTRVLTARRDTDSDEYQSMWGEVEDFEREGLIAYLVADDHQGREAAVEAELASEEEWSENDYLQGLTDAWADGLSDRYIEDPTDAEALRCFTELTRFAAIANERLESGSKKLTDELSELPDEVLQSKVFTKVVEVRGSMTWLTTYRRMEVYLGTREADRRTKYFTNPGEVGELPVEVFSKLSAVYRELTVDPLEGKGSEEIPDSSSSSESSDEAVTGASSGPREAAA